MPTPTHTATHTPRPTNTPAPTGTRPPYTATPEGTPAIWATIIALPTATPSAGTGGDDLMSACAWVIGGGGAAALMCTDSMGRSWTLPVDVSVTCPSAEVLRQPYPRGLVSVPNYFGLLPATYSPSMMGEWSAPGDVYSLQGLVDSYGNPLEAGLVRNAQYGLRAQRLVKNQVWVDEVVPDTKWEFTGPSSNGDPRTQFGITTTYSYAAASYVGPNANVGAQPNKGRAFDRAARLPSSQYDLPAYPISITSYCGFDESVKIELSVAYWHQFSACFAAPLDEAGDPYVPAGHSYEGCPTGMISFGETRYRWEPTVLMDWTPKDLRVLGQPLPYLPFRGATGGGIFKSVIYREPRNNGIWVPVVEVQTVQQDD